MTARRISSALLLSVLLVTIAPRAVAQCVSLTTTGSASTQNFNTLSNTAASTTNNLTLTGWFMTETGGGTRDNDQYAVDTGGSNTGDTFSYGPAGNTDRALGGLQSGTLIPVIGVCFTNNTGTTLTSLDVAYTGEQWRIGNNAAARDDRMDFQYSLDATSLTTGAWTNFDTLDFTNPIKTAGAAGALDGNAAANRTAISQTIPTLSIANGATFWIRWNDLNASGADDGLSVDDFSLTPQGGPVLPNLTIGNVSQVETNGATTTFTFPVTLSAPAGPGGVTFDIATADGTAQDDNPGAEDNDYVAQSLTGQTIPMGSTGPYNFNVTVNGDVIPEPNETFFVNVTSVTGANVTDGQGQGTIQNDDVACADLSINNVTQAETNGGTTTFAFTVSLSQAGCGTVTFDIATADGTAQDDNPGTEDNDYVAQSLTGQTVTFPGTYTFNVTVNGDTAAETDETFFVNITNVSPGNVQVADDQGLGTIVNEDFTRIHDVQGNGAASPLAGQSVTMRGIVTLLKSNGFFLQEEVADYDADPNTSEGIFVFTSSAPTVAVGDDATVTGTVVEFNGMTEISPVTNVTTNSTGNALPTAVTLTALDLPPAAGPDQPQLEKYESMRLLAPALVTVAPNDDFSDVETVLTPQPRPFREPGIPASDPIPPDPTSGLPDPNIPIWDENPERLNVDTNGRAGSTGETLTSNVALTNVAGPLDFAFGRYRLINEANLTRTADMSAVPVPVPAANEFTIAGYNIENFNNNATQRQKAALTIRDVLQLPDIIGTIEIFDLADLQALATEVQTISGVTYSAHLIEQDGTSGDNDQDVGFLIKTSRVSVTSVTAERTADTFINPNNGLPELLHDRPPLLLTGTVDPSGPSPLPVFVIVNHLRSFIDVELVAGEGPRVRAKRKAQAESLADLLNDLQTANPTTPVISVGDYNAFQFNSGYDDSISVLKGMPTPDDQIVVDQSPDLVNPDYSNLFENVPAAQRYSFIFEGTPQSLDHMLVNAAAEALNTGIAVARVNADFPEVSAAVYLSNPARPERNSDHDPVVGYFLITAPGADVSITKTLDTAGPYFHGQSVTYTLTVANAGPAAATNIDVTDTPANLTITGVSGACAALPCTIASLASGANTNITVTATIVAPGAFDNSADANADETDPNGANNTDNTGNGGTAAASADVSITKTLDTAGPYYEGQSVTYTINVANAGPSTATGIDVTDTPANLTITGVSGACASLPCTIASLAAGANTNVTVTATIIAPGAFDNSADANADEADPNSANNTDNTGNGGTAGATADVSVTKSLDTAGPYYAGQSVTYTITVANAGPSTATNIGVTDTPSNLTITNVSGACTSFSPCTIASLASGASTNITVTATIDAAGAFDNSVTVTADENDFDTADNTDNTGNGGTATSSADVSVTKTLDTGGPYTIGQSVTYTIVVANAGPSTATDINVTDTPTNLTITNVSGACGALPCTIASLASGGSANITVTATIVSSGAFSNTATANATESDPDGSDNSDSDGDTASQANEVTATKSVSGTFVQGTNVTYTIVITNNMTVTQPDNFQHEFTDVLPAGLTYVSSTATSGTAALVVAPDTFAWNGSIPPGGTVTITITCTISPTAAGTISNQGQTIFDTDGDNSNDSSHLTDDPSTAAVDDPTSFAVLQSGIVEITKAVSGTFVQGTNVTYTIVLTNNMTVTQPDNFGHESTDSIPAGLTFVSANATSGTVAAVVSNTVVVWNGSIPSGGTVTITIVCSINPTATGIISNQANSIFDKDGDNQNESEEFSDDPSTAAANDPTVFTVVQANVVEVTKAVSGTFVQGSNVTYTIVMTNNMTVTQPDNFGHEFTDNLPAGLTLVPGSFTATSGTNGSVSNIFFWDGSIPSGGTVTLTFQATISPTATGQICNQGQSIFDRDGDNQNESSELTDDPSTGAVNDPTCFTVIPTGTVSAAKSVSGGPYTQGSNVIYTVVLTNNMGITQADNAGNELTDVLPASLTLVGANATGGTAVATVGTNTVTWNGSLAPGASVTITITATINNTATGTVSNQASFSYDADGNGSNETSGVSDDPGTGTPNDPTSFTVSTGGDTDGDGVPDTVEQAAPNGGDGNGDGIPDYQQITVASIPAATGNGYLTLQSSCTLQEVYVVEEGDLPTDDHGHRYPHGLIAFRAPCSSATFSLFIYGSGSVSSYRKYGPLPPGGPAQWYQLPGATFQVVTVGSLHPRRVNFSLTDGGTGDDTPVDGVIVDQGGPSDPDAAVPTASEWALLMMAGLLAMAGVLVMKRT
jgi:uncharacterized repeat protein (TIGR01451 family)